MILVVFITITVYHLKEVILLWVILKHRESVEVYKVGCEPAWRISLTKWTKESTKMSAQPFLKSIKNKRHFFNMHQNTLPYKKICFHIDIQSLLMPILYNFKKRKETLGNFRGTPARLMQSNAKDSTSKFTQLMTSII
jgi:hypothetical protein